MRLSLGSDHGGFTLKEEIKKRLLVQGHQIMDRGARTQDPVDYPDIAFSVSEDIVEGDSDLGILFCGTGIGMSNAASRVEGVVAALCTNSYMARMSRLHNGANVLCLGGRVTGDELAWDIVTAFLESEPLMDDKYVRRRNKVSSYPETEG